eukprot:CAMPEP_0172020786 /NCGR_PEP_ID=MMETSP1041-20130122/13372_1 /TAXON_ID=464988 /ORGANISM="Hemiselmis andersenii, Strain CCMP439" /LENGTH=180 /DNA_ID=CAMNT_0012676083 /DNA_START=284 /DNA_END=823 /DNA_ORIENTATION=+
MCHKHLSIETAPVVPPRRLVTLDLVELPAHFGRLAMLIRAPPALRHQRLAPVAPLQRPPVDHPPVARLAQHAPGKRQPVPAPGLGRSIDLVEARALLRLFALWIGTPPRAGSQGLVAHLGALELATGDVAVVARVAERGANKGAPVLPTCLAISLYQVVSAALLGFIASRKRAPLGLLVA